MRIDGTQAIRKAALLQGIHLAVAIVGTQAGPDAPASGARRILA